MTGTKASWSLVFRSDLVKCELLSEDTHSSGNDYIQICPHVLDSFRTFDNDLQLEVSFLRGFGRRDPRVWFETKSDDSAR